MSLSYKVNPQTRYLVENPIVFNLATDSQELIEMEIFPGGFSGESAYKGQYFPVGASPEYLADISVNDVIRPYMHRNEINLHDALINEMNFSFLEIGIRFKQGADMIEYTGKIYNGGISKRFLRYLIEKDTNIFNYKLQNGYKQFLMTTRTAGRHITIRENEICPLYFIALNRTYTIETEGGWTFTAPTLTEGNVYALNVEHVRKFCLEIRNELPSFFAVRVNNNVIFDITITPASATPNIYVIEFLNSFGAPERIEVSGKKVSAPEFGEDNAFDKYDSDIDDYIEQNDRLSLREIINAEFGYKTSEEFLFARDMLQSDSRYLIDPTGVRHEVRVKSESFMHDLHPTEPGSVPLEIRLADAETEFSPAPDESHPEGGLVPLTITFEGNGGRTVDGETVVTVEVQSGTEWKDIPFPEFLQQGTAKKQNGFTTIMNDDSSIVMSDFVVTDNMVVYASYTVIEIGFITAGGEILSAETWVSKYGDLMYNNAYPYNLVEAQRENLIAGAYFRAPGQDFGLFPHVNLGADGVIDCRATQGVIGANNMDMSLFGIPSEDSRFIDENAYVDRKFPRLFIPPDWDIHNNRGVPQEAVDRMLSYTDGRGYSEKYYQASRGYTDDFGITGSPALEEIRKIGIGTTVPAGRCYVPSFFEIDVITKNIGNLQRELLKLDTWAASKSLPAYSYTWYPVTGEYSGVGFSWVVDKYTYAGHTYSIIQCVAGAYDELQQIKWTEYRMAAYNPADGSFELLNSGVGLAVASRYNQAVPFVFDAGHLF